jgi:16S rRNA (cytosine1402-N4)-methyltransferase
MRFDRTKGKTAQEILHNASEEELVRIFREYGEEPKARFIAHAIHERRKK